MQDLLAYGDSDSQSDSEPANSPPPAKRLRAAGSPETATLESPAPASSSAGPPPLPPPPLPPPPLPPSVGTDAGDCLARPVRQFEHVDGQFAAHVFLRIRPALPLSRAVESAVSRLCSTDGSVQRFDPSEHHLSLSRTFTLQKPQLQGFSEALRVALKRCAPLPISAARSLIQLQAPAHQN